MPAAYLIPTSLNRYAMAWRLTGQLVETCSCNMFCPCWFTVQELMIMDQGWCASAIAFRASLSPRAAVAPPTLAAVGFLLALVHRGRWLPG